LERRACALEPDETTRTSLLAGVTGYAEEFLINLPYLPAYRPGEDDGELFDATVSEEPLELGALLELLRSQVDGPGVNVASPGYLAFIPGSGLYASALADYLAAVVNKYVGIFFAAPGAVRVERTVLAWMAEFLGYPPSAAGDLTSGGSIANLVGLVTAREAHQLKARDFERVVVYLSEQTHHSVAKALRIAGLGECVKRYIPLDRRFRMNPAALEETILSDHRAGLHPWLIIASAGATDTGAVDPLPAIADLAEEHDLWLHVDGAYGAAFALCGEGKEILTGIERSDSLVLDPHKGLFLPFGSGAVLVRDGRHLQRAHHYSAGYLQDADTLAPGEEISPAELSPELSRPFRGLRLWLPLKLAGVAPFRAALEEKLLLARYFYEKMKQVDGFVMGPYPDLSIVTFRYLPRSEDGSGDADEFNRRLLQAVQLDGRIFLSSTTLNGRFTLRLAVLGFRTHLETIDEAVDILREKAAAVRES